MITSSCGSGAPRKCPSQGPNPELRQICESRIRFNFSFQWASAFVTRSSIAVWDENLGPFCVVIGEEAEAIEDGDGVPGRGERVVAAEEEGCAGE